MSAEIIVAVGGIVTTLVGLLLAWIKIRAVQAEALRKAQERPLEQDRIEIARVREEQRKEIRELRQAIDRIRAERDTEIRSLNEQHAKALGECAELRGENRALKARVGELEQTVETLNQRLGRYLSGGGSA